MGASSGNKRQGFTLIELSIVLIIIGLIVGGILTGRELIRAAEIRKTISQLEKFETAVNTFKGKYNCLPGDCFFASDFGFDAATNGNGSGIIGQCATSTACSVGAAGGITIYHEYIDFWYHLSAANLLANAVLPYDPAILPQNYRAGIHTPPSAITAARVFSQAGNAFPSGWVVKADIRYRWLLDPTYEIRPAHHFLLATHAMPLSAQNNIGYYASADIYAIDAKLDDGLPNTGRVRAWSLTLVSDVWPYALANGCAVNGTPVRYSLTTTGNCGALFKASF